MTTDTTAVAVVLAAISGLLIGALYFSALWWAVRRIVAARYPALLVAGSFLIRGALAAAAIVFVSGGRPLPLLAAVAGFLVGRTLLIRIVGAPLRVGTDAAAAPESTALGTVRTEREG